MHTPHILQKIQSAQRIVLVCHQNPDGDTLGALTAFAETLHRLGKTYRSYCATPYQPMFSFLTRLDQFVFEPSAIINQGAAPDLVMVFDSSSLEYAGFSTVLAQLPTRPFIINIDHHAGNTMFGDINVVQEKASSTCEIVYDLLRALRLPFNRPMATALLLGIVWDTGRFSNPATTARAYEAAADLMNAGADYKKIEQIMAEKSLPTLQFWGKILSQLHNNPALHFTSAVIRQDDIAASNISEEDCNGIANFLNALDGPRAIMVLREDKQGIIKGSFRTRDSLLNVEKIAKIVGIIGGGGHKKAAGFRLKGKITKTAHGFRVI